LEGQRDLLEERNPEVSDIVDKAKAAYDKTPTRTYTAGPTGDEEVVGVRVDEVTTEEHREAGPVHVGYQYWKKLGVDEVLAEAGLDERSRTLTCVMTMNRLVLPASEHAMPDWIRQTALSDILGEDFDTLSRHSLYRNLDALHPKRLSIEAGLAARERTLFNLDQTVFLYDLTSTYFEGQALANPKAKFGYSRDKRQDCRQVVVGLVVNRDGFPLAHEVFDGNTQDRKTLGAMLNLLHERVGLCPGQTVVVDRGMSYVENLAQIQSRGLHYLVASRQPERDQWLGEFEDLEGFVEIAPAGPRKKPPLKIKLRRNEGETHVLCVSPGRKEKDRAIREKQEKRFVEDVKKLEKRIAARRLVKLEKIGEAIGRLKERYPRVARYHRISYDGQTKTFSHEVDKDKLGVAEKLDGSYLLKTDRDDLTAEEIWRVYTLLTKAEEAFRSMKSPLAERPIFHKVERRVETHVFLCVLAYHLLVAIEKTLADKGVHTSFATVRQTLRTHQICTIVLPTDRGGVLRIRKSGVPEDEHRRLYRLLDVPEKIIRPRKTWSAPPTVM
jgi:transposase